ncbi:hypothetical protein C725_2677 [Pacificimonas flava]|uniref:Uncharacterized protein n=1 Tax=Pacificimonas flava TaxID=1234595 RepID=M2TK24_9SPHN|nr:hypothetical protein C725_2677 [Pacificimonas flava]
MDPGFRRDDGWEYSTIQRHPGESRDLRHGGAAGASVHLLP